VRGDEQNEKLLSCKLCGEVHSVPKLAPGMIAQCRRCGSQLMRRTRNSLVLTGAFSLAALLLFIPANIFPILRMYAYGMSSENTVWQGAQRLYQDGDYVIAVIVFLASMLIPFLKILGLLFLVISTKLKSPRWKPARTSIYKFIDRIGRWAMLDVFALAILVSLVKLQRLATVVPGSGLFAFGLVIVFTLFASASFDAQLIWDEEDEEESGL
jgi:paraquat-inducible protein A